ncbi:MAG: NUDIX domain-containing protein [Sphingomonadaceae bacterium]|uniref:NUDIX hydrolase n=1 Tax=Thermaurantiacus sp. TaxID=2820283 RepID=UPI00298EFF88|nr:NUDIX domain-containing protein [Thermaurantiacus sp.]MCS6985873.1 NUDIX domain-containing protein [Sphingomonadaceae bacterium]MDW8413858.1 NUDIX domain-containing protein [Thermaurantiacus sp.]
MTAHARPRDAATLVLVDRSESVPRLLMGRRAATHAFMPGKWVFPGGRVDRADWYAPVLADLPPEVAEAVAQAPRRPPACPRRFARALALAAVRETFEETGLVLGRRAAPVRGPGAWARFLAAGYRADLSGLSYLARAVTPPGRPRRFDARFFLADASALLSTEPVDSHELEELRWVSLADARLLDLPAVTRLVLQLLERRWRGEEVPPPFWAWHRRAAD